MRSPPQIRYAKKICVVFFRYRRRHHCHYLSAAEYGSRGRASKPTVGRYRLPSMLAGFLTAGDGLAGWATWGSGGRWEEVIGKDEPVTIECWAKHGL